MQMWKILGVNPVYKTAELNCYTITIVHVKYSMIFFKKSQINWSFSCFDIFSFSDQSHVEISIVMETKDGETVSCQELCKPVKVPVAPKAAKRWRRPFYYQEISLVWSLEDAED